MQDPTPVRDPGPTHLLQTFSGVAEGSFSAPDHEYPAHLELRLTATDSGGLTGTASVRLDPRTVVLTFQSQPAGLQLVANGAGSSIYPHRDPRVGELDQRHVPTDGREPPL